MSGRWALGPISAEYWRVVKTRRTCLSPRLMSICEMMDTTLILMLTVAKAPTWKLHAGSDGHNSHFDVNCSQSPDLEIACGKRWPPSLILPPASKPHDHRYDVLKIFDTGALA